jgi:hypothetical protein
MTHKVVSSCSEKNAEIYCDIVPKIVDAAPQAVLLVVTDPPDPLADIARKTRPGATVLSAGTYLMSTEAEESRPADSTSILKKKNDLPPACYWRPQAKPRTSVVLQ